MNRADIAGLCGIAALLSFALGGFTASHIDRGRIDTLTKQLAAAEATVDLQEQSINAMVKTSQDREKAAAAAIAKAQADGAADRAEALRLLSLQPPAGDRCEAASALVDQAIAQERQ